jgi:hypothetical protein
MYLTNIIHCTTLIVQAFTNHYISINELDILHSLSIKTDILFNGGLIEVRKQQQKTQYMLDTTIRKHTHKYSFKIRFKENLHT